MSGRNIGDDCCGDRVECNCTVTCGCGCGRSYCGSCHYHHLVDKVVPDLRARVFELEAKLNTPQLRDFSTAVMFEAAHQRERWGVAHDAGKEPSDWLWLLGHLAGKALRAHIDADVDKALHHCVSSAAVLANWHAAITGTHTAMRPGIEPPAWTPPEEKPLVGIKTHGVIDNIALLHGAASWALDRNGRTWRGTEAEAVVKAESMNEDSRDKRWSAETLTPAMQADGSL